MKKIVNFLIGAILGLVLVSCGTSSSEKITHQSNAKKVLKESFGEENAKVETQMPAVATIRLIDSVFIPACKSLDVKKCFSVSKEEGIANFYLGSNYNDWLYNHAGNLENLPGFMLYIYQTTQSTTDREILAQTAGVLLSEAELAQAWGYLISKQPNAEPGKLLTNSYSNVSHVRLDNGGAVAVHAWWSSAFGEWRLHAYAFDLWGVGGLVFSRGRTL